MAGQIPRGADPYYWLTSQLSARGAQKSTTRLIAGVILGLGAVPLVIAFSAYGPQGLWRHVIAAVITVSCVAMGLQWLRSGWPSRGVSRFCALAGTVFIAVSSVVVSNPLIGLVGLSASAVLTFYVALFHSFRVLVTTWLIYLVALVVVAEQLALADIPVAIAGFLVIALTNVFASFTTRIIQRLIQTDLPARHLEPVTGLLNREGFGEQMATLLGARSRHDDRFLVVLVVSIDNPSGEASRGAANTTSDRVALAQSVREAVRREAVVAHPHSGEFLVGDLFTDVDPSPLSLRLQLAVANASPRVTASIGVVSTPLSQLSTYPPYDVLDELLAIASAAMAEARAAGGNQTRHAIRPRLEIFGDDYTPDLNHNTPMDRD